MAIEVDPSQVQTIEVDPSQVQPMPVQKPAGNFLERALRPVDEALTEGSRMIYEGGKAAWNEPTWERKSKGVSQALRGAGTVMSPALAPAALANPIATAGRLGAGLLAQKAVEGGAKMVGVPEGYAELGGDVAGLGAAGAGPPSRTTLNSTGRALKGAVEGATNTKGWAPGAVAGGSLGYELGGPHGAAMGVALGGGLPAVRGAIQGGIKGWRNEPPVIPPRTAPPPPITGWRGQPPSQSMTPAPPIQGSNAPPVSQRPTAPPPAIQGWRGEPIAQPLTPPPPIQGSNARPVVATPPPTKAPPLRWNAPEKASTVPPNATPVVNTVQPSETPSPNPSTPSTPEPSTVLNTVAKRKAASALSKELGGKGNKPLVIPAEETPVGTSSKIAKDVMTGLRKGGITPDNYKAATPGQKSAVEAHIREYVKSKGLNKAVAQEVIESLGGMALGGVVDSAPAQKSKVRKSKRGILYGPPGELRKLKAK